MTTTPVFSLGNLAQGARLTVPLLPGVLAFGASFGAVAKTTGLSLAEAVAMSVFIFAGAAQFAALSVWQGSWTLVGAVLAVLLVATVNSRFILLSAAMRPPFAGVPAPQAYGSLLWLTDASWLVGLRAEHLEKKVPTAAVMLGCGLTLWVFWVLATIPGWWLGAMVADPKRYAIDLVMLVFFAAMFVPMWKGRAKAIPWVVGGVVAMAGSFVLPNGLHVLVGAITGALAGAFLDD